MGLDVYLNKCADIASADAAEKEYNEKSEEIWNKLGDYNNLTDEQKNMAHAETKAVADVLGLSELGVHQGREGVEINSTIDPEHMFKIGYFRSSYNEGGINRVLSNLGLPDLSGIMGAPDDGSNFSPDWDASLTRVNDVIASYEQHLVSPMAKYGVTEVRPMWEFGVSDQKSALALFQEHLESKAKHGHNMNHYSNRDGEFMLSGMKVVGVITKQFTPSRNPNPLEALLNRPSVYLIYEKEPSDKPDWYLTALKIVRETCEYVIVQPDRQHYYMVWSG